MPQRIAWLIMSPRARLNSGSASSNANTTANVASRKVSRALFDIQAMSIPSMAGSGRAKIVPISIMA